VINDRDNVYVLSIRVTSANHDLTSILPMLYHESGYLLINPAKQANASSPTLVCRMYSRAIPNIARSKNA
jgi:hypothetical protein